jgi:hypothetical protein
MKELTKKQIDSYLSEIYMLLYTGPCQVRMKEDLRDESGKRCWALYDPGAAENGDDILWISAEARNYLINSIIHECLHALHDDYSETKVCWLASQISRKMSAIQQVHLIIFLAENLKRHYHPKSII